MWQNETGTSYYGYKKIIFIPYFNLTMLFFNPCYIHGYFYFVCHKIKKLEKKLKSKFQHTRHSASPFFYQHCV